MDSKIFEWNLSESHRMIVVPQNMKLKNTYLPSKPTVTIILDYFKKGEC